MKAVVTGGAGFIGSHLVRSLLEEGAEVHIIDNISTGNESYVPYGAGLHRLDIRDEETAQLIRNQCPDIVFHQAAQADVQHSVGDPGFDAAVNITGTVHLIQACCQASVKKVIMLPLARFMEL
jgi:UDP-glucose 4-epimerase